MAASGVSEQLGTTRANPFMRSLRQTLTRSQQLRFTVIRGFMCNTFLRVWLEKQHLFRRVRIRRTELIIYKCVP